MTRASPLSFASLLSAVDVGVQALHHASEKGSREKDPPPHRESRVLLTGKARHAKGVRGCVQGEGGCLVKKGAPSGNDWAASPPATSASLTEACG
jgi:hypothetical protein